jgi:hypothetical protein
MASYPLNNGGGYRILIRRWQRSKWKRAFGAKKLGF